MLELNPKTADKLLSLPEGRELRDFITRSIRALDRVTGIPVDWDDRRIAVAVAARKLAAEKLAEILKPFLNESPQDDRPQDDEGGLYNSHLENE